MTQKHKLKLINMKNIYSLWPVHTYLMVLWHFPLWADYLNCPVLLLFPDGMPLTWVRAAHKHELLINMAVRHHQGTGHSSMHKQGDVFTTGQGRCSCSIWRSHWCFLCASITVCLQVASLKTASVLYCTQLLPTEALAERQKEIFAHPQSFKILCKGGKLHKILKWPGETDVEDMYAPTTGCWEEFKGKKATIEGHWDAHTTVLAYQAPKQVQGWRGL